MIRTYSNPWQLLPCSQQPWRQNCLGRPLSLEIGAGTGVHARDWGLAHPDKVLIALERTVIKSQGLIRRCGELNNVLALKADATAWVSQHIHPGELEHIFILYPNPYPKTKQANKRWHYMPFMGHLIECLAPSGKIHLATNIADYANDARHIMQNNWQLSCIEHRHLPADFIARTAFEKKYLERDEACFNLVWTRR